MGRKTGTETAIGLVVCFLEQRTWTQAALARRLEVTVPVVRKKLLELQSAGVLLERDDDPPNVYWSVPKKGWIPNTVRLEPGDVNDLLRLLTRLPKSAMRSRVMARVLEGYVGAKAVPGETAIVAPPVAAAEETWLALVEDAASRGEVLEMRYLSASRGAMETRHVSPHRVVVDAHTRFLATCHKSDTLKWFRVDRITFARPVGVSGARRADPLTLEEAIATSVNGYRGAEEVAEVRFFVREPESRWVESNLPSPLSAAKASGGVLVSGRTAAVVQVARFVAGLGAAAVCESPELRAVLRDLAEGALATNSTERATSRANRHATPVME